MRKPLRLVVLAAGALAVVACSKTIAGGAGPAYIRDTMRDYRFPRACDALWVDALRVIADHGYGLVGSDRELVGQDKQGAVSHFLNRGHATTRDDAGVYESVSDNDGQGLRFMVRGKPADKGGCFVQYFAVQEDRANFSEKAHRDYDLELKLLATVDPAAAARIADAADRAQ